MAQDCKMFLSIVKSPVQKSGAGVRLIHRSMSGSVQLKNLWLKSLTSVNEAIHEMSAIHFVLKILYSSFLIIESFHLDSAFSVEKSKQIEQIYKITWNRPVFFPP